MVDDSTVPSVSPSLCAAPVFDTEGQLFHARYDWIAVAKALSLWANGAGGNFVIEDERQQARNKGSLMI